MAATLSIDDYNIPAKLVIGDYVYDVVVENIERKEDEYPFGRGSYYDPDEKRMIHGESILVEKFVCKRIVTSRY